MVTATLALNAALGLATAFLYIFVARVFGQRETTSEDADKAKRAFLLWWIALAVGTGIGALQQLLAAFGVVDVGVHATFTFFVLPPILLALAGLLQYLVYIHTGSLRWHTLILASHIALALIFFGLVAYLRATSIVVGDWGVEIEYERTAPGWVNGFALASIILPVVVASAAYLTLAFRTTDKLARFRIYTVSGAFLFWFGSAGLAGVLGLGEWYWWPLVARAIGLVSTLMILFAYRPGRGIEERLRSDDDSLQGAGNGGPGTLRLAYVMRARRAAQAKDTSAVA